MNGFWSAISEYIFRSPLFFAIVAVMIRCIFATFYLWLLYYIISGIKKIFHNKMSVRANYYCWYALLLCLPLSGLGFNNVVKLPLYVMYFSDPYGVGWQMCCGLCILWILIIYYRLAAHIVQNIKLESSLNKMKNYDDGRGLKRHAADAFGLHSDRIGVVVADFVSSPVSYGVFRKTIILPKDFESRYTDTELSLLLLHEAAHIKNKDTAKLSLIGLVSSFVWLPPGFSKSFKRDSEILCDNRVMSIQSKERDQYSDLLIKECSSGSAIKGLAFSDSYHVIESRIDALYRYKPVRHRFALFSVAVFAAMLLLFLWSYMVSDKWFRGTDLNDAQPDIFVSFAGEDLSSIMELHDILAEENGESDNQWREHFTGIYEIENGIFRLDQRALYESVSHMEKQGAGVEAVAFRFLVYEIDSSRYIGQYTRKYYTNYTFITGDLEQVDENDRYFIGTLEIERTLDEYIYSFAAHWL